MDVGVETAVGLAFPQLLRTSSTNKVEMVFLMCLHTVSPFQVVVSVLMGLVPNDFGLWKAWGEFIGYDAGRDGRVVE